MIAIRVEIRISINTRAHQILSDFLIENITTIHGSIISHQLNQH